MCAGGRIIKTDNEKPGIETGKARSGIEKPAFILFIFMWIWQVEVEEVGI